MDAYASGISPGVFWGLTLGEIHLAIRARGKQIEGYYEVCAWLASRLMSVWVDRKDRNKITPDALLGRKSKVMEYTEGNMQSLQRDVEKLIEEKQGVL